MAQLRFAVLLLYDRAVVDDERDRQRQSVDNWTREVKAAAGDERDFDAAFERVGQRRAVRLRHRPLVSSRVPSISMARRRINQSPVVTWPAATCNTIAAIFHTPFSSVSVN